MFGLCRKKSSGTSVRPPLFSEVFFEEQESVDQFVTSYDSASRIVDKVFMFWLLHLHIACSLLLCSVCMYVHDNRIRLRDATSF